MCEQDLNMSFDLFHTFYQSVKSVSFLRASTKKVAPELQYDWRSNLVLVYYVCVFVFVHLLHIYKYYTRCLCLSTHSCRYWLGNWKSGWKTKLVTRRLITEGVEKYLQDGC